MKRLLSLVAVAALVAAMLPGTGFAGLRGAFEPIGRGDAGGFGNGLPNGLQQAAQRPVPAPAGNGLAILERWYAFSTRSQVVGQETSREIWQAMNRATSGLLVADIMDARRPILKDENGLVSYADPAWSPNGRFLAYTLTNSQVSEASIVVQEYLTSNTMSTAVTTVGGPIAIVGGASVRNRHPDWSPDGNSLAFDSDVSGTSTDIYTVQVFPTVGLPVKKTFVANRTEQNPAWNPAGDKIAYDTNHFGPNVIEIVDVNTLAVTLAETNFGAISHSNPDWSSDGNSIYYDAPENEDATANPDIWKLDLATQAKCSIHMDGAGDVNPSVSSYANVSGGASFNTFIFESQAFPGAIATPFVTVWRANPLQTCVSPLPMAIVFSPSTVNVNKDKNVKMTLSFPDEVRNQGFIMNPANLNGKDGVRFRNTASGFAGGFFPSPLVLGLSPNLGENTGLPYDVDDPAHETVLCTMSMRTLGARMTALGLTGSTVPVEVKAYSNNAGRTFRGFGYLHTTGGNGAGAVALEQNSPNPFNPSTKIRFATSKAGSVSLRVYNVRGELVKTIVNERMSQGSHEVSWDGRATSGQTVASGIYYAKAALEGGASDVIKMMVAK